MATPRPKILSSSLAAGHESETRLGSFISRLKERRWIDLTEGLKPVADGGKCLGIFCRGSQSNRFQLCGMIRINVRMHFEMLA